MTNLTDEFFETALAGIQERLDDLITQPKSEGDPPDKWAKSFSALIKAEADAKARLDDHRAKAFAKQHTRYEDMPPPTPEDEARFDAEFKKILSALFDEDPYEGNDKSQV
jgi:hypothetical protein